METYNNIEVVGSYVLIIWSCGLVWASWQIHIMRVGLAEERAELRRWGRLKAVWEAQRGMWQ
jgi:hypothetical protein